MAVIKLDELDKKLLICLQEDFPLVLRPFQEIAKRLGTVEEEVFSRVRRFKSQGIIKRIGPIHNSETLKFKRTLIGMDVPEDKLKEVVGMVNSFNEVTHNYLREDSEFNLWFTLICQTEKRINAIIKTIRQRSAIKRIVNLPTIKTIKIKTVFKP